VKINNSIIILSSVIVIIVSTTLFQLVIPLINDGGNCYGNFTRTCESAIGVKIPMWWRMGSETMAPVSLFFGILCGAIVGVLLLLKMENSKDDNSDEE